MKIISGAQTGADRAGLDAAIANGITTGGHCTKGCLTENGFEPELISKYNLIEDEISGPRAYQRRTKLNIINSDITILFVKKWSAGSIFTKSTCNKLNVPLIIVDANKPIEYWYNKITEHFVLYNTINIAGNRESVAPGIYNYVFVVMNNVLVQLKSLI